MLYFCSDNFLIAHIFKTLQIIYLECNADFDAFQLNLNKKFFDKEYFLNKQSISDDFLLDSYVYKLYHIYLAI